MRASDQQGISRDQMMSILFKASTNGDLLTLRSVIKQDSQILNRISLTDLHETPLHISSSCGHLDFTKELLSLKPTLVTQLDYSNRTALHVASAEGHIDIVKELLKINKDPCLFRDEKGRIPLYYAVMRGRLEVVRELIRAKSESLSVRVKGETIFHVCVKYNNLETLKALIEAELDITDDRHLNFTSVDGTLNTILHLAVMLKQVETTSYLLSVSEIRQVVGLKNKLGLTAYDILEHVPKELEIYEIRDMLKATDHPISSPTTEIRGIEESHVVEGLPQPATQKTTQPKGWRNILGFMTRMLNHNNPNWLDEMRGNLSLVATVISTITFQALINPPGGFVQQSILKEDPFKCIDNDEGESICPGDAISAVTYSDLFHPYLKYNTICFIGSLCVILLVVSGVPLKHRVVVWVLSIAMCITLTFLSLTYLQGLYLVTPDGELFKSANKLFRASLYCWIGFLSFVALFFTLCFVFGPVKRAKNKLNRQI
ncbi:ankyrin repeat-containing protein NPR4-like [Neltuma alba]|uniref:ankyrin repeat-containing protein NPR4-like n=1 Tax=Neltuma alba TaxID=207710 RepID=UPI0010A2D9F3|nr:ankyrin repeat-containing protein NPR4-like [Prosopis alba]